MEIDHLELRKVPKTQTFNRMLSRGVDHTDYEKILQRVNSGEDYVHICEALADKSYQYAKQELQNGHTNTARIFFMKAAALYRIGSYDILYYNEEKKRIYEKELDSFSRGIQLYDNLKAEKLEIPYKNSILSGWLLLPNRASSNVPVIIMFAGLTGFKEEAHSIAMAFVERGFAVANMDGPGQGESFYVHNCYLEVNTQDAHNAILDYILNYSCVGNKIGLYGLCFGGYLVARTAGYYPDKVAACASVGGAYTAKEGLRFNKNFLDAAIMRAGLSSDDLDISKFRQEVVSKYNLQGIADKITCPLLILHNNPDPLISAKNIQQLYDEAASSDKTIKLYPGPDHNVHNDNTEATTYVVDWFADRLFN